MYVCLCNAVSVRSVKSAIEGGAGTVDEVGRACGAGTDCGSCRETIGELIEEQKAASAPRRRMLRVVPARV